jgi:hypothetical protein
VLSHREGAEGSRGDPVAASTGLPRQGSACLVINGISTAAEPALSAAKGALAMTAHSPAHCAIGITGSTISDPVPTRISPARTLSLSNSCAPVCGLMENSG